MVFGSLPLVLNAFTTMKSHQRVLAQQEKENLGQTTDLLRLAALREIDAMELELRRLGIGLGSLGKLGGNEAVPTGAAENAPLAREFIGDFQRTVDFDTRVVDLLAGRAQRYTMPEIQGAMDAALQQIRAGEPGGRYALVPLGLGQDPAVVVSSVFPGAGLEQAWVVQAVGRLPLTRAGLDGAYVVDIATGGAVLWAAGTEAEPVKDAVRRSPMVQSFLDLPAGRDIIPVMEYETRVGGNSTPMIGQVTRLGDTGWGLVVEQPRSTAFRELRKLVRASALSAGALALLALVFAGVATRLFTRPIIEFANTTRAIAHGRFGQTVEPMALGAEMGDLADSFNTMSVQISDQVDRLRQAAHINRDLFIGSIRALLTAIEAKEPYTRGHSERVAAYSQVISAYYGLPAEQQERIWIAGLLHDVGKIGIDDRVLKKGDVLTDEEYEEMKRHPAIGAEIMASIEQLRDILPAIRWHHEDWAGTGYPDGLRGEEIPMMARIVAVADTFDAITTQRVYQNPYTDEEALGIIQKLIGKRFAPDIADAFLRAYTAGDIQRGEAPGIAESAPQPVAVTEAVHT